MADTTQQTTDENTIIFVKQVMAAEDMMFGFGTTAQIREGINVPLTKINAYTMPYDNTRSVGQVLDELLANQTLGA